MAGQNHQNNCVSNMHFFPKSENEFSYKIDFDRISSFMDFMSDSKWPRKQFESAPVPQ